MAKCTGTLYYKIVVPCNLLRSPDSSSEYWFTVSAEKERQLYVIHLIISELDITAYNVDIWISQPSGRRNASSRANREIVFSFLTKVINQKFQNQLSSLMEMHQHNKYYPKTTTITNYTLWWIPASLCIESNRNFAHNNSGGREGISFH